MDTSGTLFSILVFPMNSIGVYPFRPGSRESAFSERLQSPPAKQIRMSN